MKKHILYILPLLGAMLMTGCSDDSILPEIPDTPDGGEGVYTIEVDVESLPGSRDANDPVFNDAKVVWRYGDTLRLKQMIDNKEKTYDFILKVQSGKHNGDAWEPSENKENPIFLYNVSSHIPNYTNFTGTLEYHSVNHKDKVANGYSPFAYVANATDIGQNIFGVWIPHYNLQETNNSTEQLKDLDLLSAEIKGQDLTEHKVVTLRRNYAILKIVLDDIYYPIYGGSMLFVNGIAHDSSNKPILKGMILGKNDLLKTTSDYSTYYSLDETKDDPDAWLENVKKIKPFLKVSDTKDDITGYAVRDAVDADDADRHRIVAYMVVTGDCKIPAGGRITVALRDQWSRDWYFWQTEPMRAFTLNNGEVYTLDFTKRSEGRYVYHSTAAISTSQNYVTHMATTNLGAQSLWDAGDYYMFGYDTPIHPGGYYPFGEVATPYFYYVDEENGKYDLGFSAVNANGSGTSIGASFTFLDSNTNPDQYKEDYLIGTGPGHTVKIKSDYMHHPKDWWSEWAKGIKELPYIAENVKWQLPHHNIKYKNNNRLYDGINSWKVVSRDGQLGIKIKFKHTRHTVIIPVSGILEPSAVNSLHQTVAGATAQVKAGTENYAVMAGYGFYMIKENNVKKVKTTGYYFDAGANDSTVNLVYSDLQMAIPVRPTLFEDKNELIDAIIDVVKE